jgi:HlyD family secretion protein
MAFREDRHRAVSRMKKLLILLGPVLVLLGWIWVRRAQPPEIPFARASRETLVSTLTTNGKVEPVEWAAIRAEGSGPVEKIFAQRGELVREGQLLLALNSAEAREALSSAQARIAQSQAELETLREGGSAPERAEIESGLARARADLANAHREYEALRRLAEKQAATQAEVLEARQVVERAELQIRALETKRSALVTKSDTTAAEARLREAQSAAATASRSIDSSQIRSPMAGILYDFDLRPGAYLQPGDVIGRVGRLDELRVAIYVDEPELGRVEKGMPVTITWDAKPGQQWKGTVEQVPTQVVPLGTRQVGEVIATIDNPDHGLIPGTNVNAEIRSRVVPNALTIPTEAVRREGGRTGVLKLQDDRILWQPVELGASSITRVQVTDGLSPGDLVALPVDRPLSGGDRVQPRVMY